MTFIFEVVCLFCLIEPPELFISGGLCASWFGRINVVCLAVMVVDCALAVILSVRLRA